MNKTQIIPHALELAENIAEIILKDSYRTKMFGEPNELLAESSIKDILLFGSTLRGEPAHDIDMLVIHQNGRLNEFGFATVYDNNTAQLVPHPTANIQEAFYHPESILKAMGGEGIGDIFDMEWEVRDAKQRQITEMRVLENHYLGTLQLPYIGEIKFVKPVPLNTLMDAVDQAINEKLRSKMIATKVKALMEKQKLDVNEVLDLHVMNAGLLLGEMPEEREIIVAQCKDPTFWNTVLSTGALYNPSSKKFELPVDSKYNNASNLFPH